MTPEDVVALVLAGVGVVLQLAFMYIPGFSDWYQNNPNKGLIALGIDFAFGAIYFGLGCVPVLADLLKIALTCDLAGVWVLLQAFFMIAIGQQLTYNFLKKQVRAKQLG